MSKYPFFSILTASLNRRDSLRLTLDSVAGQRFDALEHIVVDGGSSDGSQALLRNSEGRCAPRWISEPDAGISSALNKALKLARGVYLLVLHADDRLLGPDTLQHAYGILKSNDADVISFPVLKERDGRTPLLYRPIPCLWWYHFKTVFPHQGCLVHRRVYDRIGGFRTQFSIAMDYDFFYRALQSGIHVRRFRTPIALMGGKGVSSDPRFPRERLREERMVQVTNETSIPWRTLQTIFHVLYIPYKTFLTRSGRGPGLDPPPAV